MLTVVRTPEPALAVDPARWPAAIAPLLQPLRDNPRACAWIVPTGRRKRALLHDWLQQGARPALLLPGLHTLESFVGQALEYSTRQKPLLDGTERILRLARAWQQTTGHFPGPGLVGQLSRYARDWQAAGLAAPAKPSHVFERTLRIYLDGLEADGRLDRLNRVVELTRELRKPKSWPNRLYLAHLSLIVVDGFHLLERVELELIAALAGQTHVLLRLIGAKDQPEWATLESATTILGEQVKEVSVIDEAPDASTLADAGRRLRNANIEHSTSNSEPRTDDLPCPGLVKLEADGLREEVEAVAARIKQDYRAAQAAGQPMRLSEVAVVIPGPGYDPLVREIFPRAGLEFNLAGRALEVATARPARVLQAALELIAGDWRHELLVDLLHHPLVRRRLDNAYRLDYLFGQRPRGRRRLDLNMWVAHWQRHLDRLGQQLASWQAGGPLPEGTPRTREQLIASTRTLRDSLIKLLESLRAVLEPVVTLEAALRATASDQPLSGFCAACVGFLDALEIERWLSPPGSEREQLPETPHPLTATPPVPWVEYEKDQQAYFKLVGILRVLAGLPASCVPAQAGLHDRLALLRIALGGETYQIRTEDDAGVQVFELREIRGLQFRHVYALGLVDGQVPPNPEEGIAAQLRRRFPVLVEQQEQRQREHLYLFRQLFEAAREQLVLSRPTRADNDRTLPSKFVSALEPIAVLEPATLVSSPREAARLVGTESGRAGGVSPLDRGQSVAVSTQTASGGPSTSRSRGLTPPARQSEGACEVAGDGAILADLRSRRDDWLARPDFPNEVLIDAPALLKLVFPEGRSFSPSDLETYAACPFRYFGTRVLRLEERDPDQARMHYGMLVHRVLQKLYVELRQAFSGDDAAPLPAIGSDKDRARLRALFEQEWANLADGLVPPDLRTLFQHEQGVLQLGLEAVQAIEENYGNLLNEHAIKDVHLGVDAQGRPVALTGTIDRVDVRRDSCATAIVLDYKTGKPTKSRKLLEKKLADGRLIQLLLYAAALRETLGLQVVGGAYVHLSERHEEHGKSAVTTIGGFALKKVNPVPLDIDAGVRMALELAGSMRDGNFSLTQHDDECGAYCPLRHACRQKL